METATTTTAGQYRVVCEDGQVRHAAGFATRREASEFAEWGHCCTAFHTIDDHFGSTLAMRAVAFSPFHSTVSGF